MDFPRFVFIVPGSILRQGGTFGQVLVEGQDEFDAYLDEGFSSTLPEAIEVYKNPKPKDAPADLNTPVEPVAGEKPKRGRPSREA